MLKSMKRLLMIAICSAVVGAMNSRACTKPVFRYALDRWPASPYHLTVLHKGPLAESFDERLESLCPEDAYGFTVAHADIDGDLPEGVIKDNWIADPDPARLPLAILQPPAAYGSQPTVVWEGSIDEAGAAKLRALIYPPPVRHLIRSICEGDTAVWMLIKGPDAKANRRFRNRIEKSLDMLQKELKLPHELDPNDTEYDSDMAPGVPMKLAFSLLDVDLEKPEMALLKGSLAASAPHLESMEGPLAVPVFARGRALAVFTPEELTEEVLAEVCHFLVGPCSCRVKALNPGFDLIMPFPWDRVLWDETLDLDALLKALTPGE
jgi:hypothetical protein